MAADPSAAQHAVAGGSEWIPTNAYFGPVLAQIQGSGGVDLDISALAYRADGTMADVAYFKNPSIFGGAIAQMGDAVNSWGYTGSLEGTFVVPHQLPADVKFVFFIVNVRSGGHSLADTGAQLRLADGGAPGGRYLRLLPLPATTACLAAVLIRPPEHQYPPEWSVQYNLNLCGPGIDFNDSLPLVERYLAACVDPALLDGRPPNDPTQFFDLTKNAAYFLDPAMPFIHMGLGWQTTCDLDAHCFLLDSWYQKVAHVYRGRLSAPGVQHSGNSTRGTYHEIDETITCRLHDLDAAVKHMVFFVRIAQGEEYRDADGNTCRRPAPDSFAQIPRCFVTMMDPNGRPLCSFNPGQDFLKGRTRMMCVISRFGRDNRWQLIPFGNPTVRSVDDSDSARRCLVEATRPDLLRRIHVVLGAIKGRNLVAKDRGGTSDPYVEIKWCDHHTKKKTDKIKKTLNPEWNVATLIDYKGPILDCLERIDCRVDVYDSDMLLDEHMGRATVHVSEFLAIRGRGPVDKWLTLGQKHPGEKKAVSGDVLIRMTCNPLP